MTDDEKAATLFQLARDAFAAHAASVSFDPGAFDAHSAWVLYDVAIGPLDAFDIVYEGETWDDIRRVTRGEAPAGLPDGSPRDGHRSERLEQLVTELRSTAERFGGYFEISDGKPAFIDLEAATSYRMLFLESIGL